VQSSRSDSGLKKYQEEKKARLQNQYHRSNEASSDSGHGTTVAIVEVRQHWQHSGAARQAVAATATQTSEGGKAMSSSGDCIIVSNAVVQCIDCLQQPQ